MVFAFMEGGKRWRENYAGWGGMKRGGGSAGDLMLCGGSGGSEGGGAEGARKDLMKSLNVFEDGGFGFVGEREFGEMSERWQKGLLALSEQGSVETLIVFLEGGSDDGMGYLVGLNKNRGAS